MTWLALSPEEWVAVRLSIKVASIATLASLPIGIIVAILLARGRFWGHSLLNGFVLLPLILPPVVLALPLASTFGLSVPNATGAGPWWRNQVRVTGTPARPPLATLLRIGFVTGASPKPPTAAELAWLAALGFAECALLLRRQRREGS